MGHYFLDRRYHGFTGVLSYILVGYAFAFGKGSPFIGKITSFKEKIQKNIYIKHLYAIVRPFTSFKDKFVMVSCFAPMDSVSLFFLGWTGEPGKGRALGVSSVKFTGEVLKKVKMAVLAVCTLIM